MTARIIIHPRCLTGPAAGALGAVLEEHGFDMSNIIVGPPSAKGYHDLCRLIGHVGDALLLERMDGSQFYHLQDAAGSGGGAA